MEAAYARDFRNVFSLHDQLRSLPLLVRCAVRVHQQRETRPVLAFTLKKEGGRMVVVAQDQGVVLIFSRLGGLDAAGELLDAPTALFLGDTWTRIEWTDDVTRRDWYWEHRQGTRYPMRALLPGFVVFFSGCAMLMPAVNPMVSVDDDFAGKPKCLIVFLPGVGDVATDFEGKGFTEAVRKRNLSVDLVSAQATLSYYALGTVVERLEADVMAPAKAKHYRQTWLIGLSMGGQGALLYAHDRPKDITGVLVLAPFLGAQPLTSKISEAGGLAKWQAPEKVRITDEDTTLLELWRWLQAVTFKKEPGPKIYLGWGTDDELLGESNRVLAEALPERRRFPVPGGHKWVAWKQALDFFLDDSDFARGCSR